MTHTLGRSARWRRAPHPIGIAILLLVVSHALAACAATPVRLPRVGYVWLGVGTVPPNAQPFIEYFRAGMREHGWIEGQNYILEDRSADNQPERYPALIADLIGLPVDVIVVGESSAAPLVAEATSTIPVVLVVGGNFVTAGFSCSFNRPCGNVTGLSLSIQGLSPKRLEKLNEIAPHLRHVGFLRNAGIPETAAEEQLLRNGAAALNVEIIPLLFNRPDELEAVLADGMERGMDGLLVMPDGVTVRNRDRIIRFAAQHGLPDGYGVENMVASGGLFSYGASREYNYQRAAFYVDRLLRGAQPADLPVEQPARFNLVLNLRRADDLGLPFPPAILQEATDAVR